MPDINIAVNASAVQLAHPTIGAEIKDMVKRSGLRPGALMLEVTESALMEELDTARAVLEQLDEFGVRVLIDDFGTGYSSLARLGELPISGLKIDRRFVRGLGRDPAVMPVIRAIADLARAYGLEVVVEGIEDGSRSPASMSSAASTRRGTTSGGLRRPRRSSGFWRRRCCPGRAGVAAALPTTTRLTLPVRAV